VAVTVQLAAQPQLADLVPRSQTFEAGPARVLAQEFVTGTALDVVVARQARPTWHELAADVLRASHDLQTAIVGLRAEAPYEGGDAEPLRADLELLARLGVPGPVVDDLAARIAGASLRRLPQHGDFWPRNVLSTASGWRVLDYESCGQLATPLFDAFHLIRGCAEAAGTGGRHWISLWAEVGAAARPLAEAVRSAAGELDIAAIEVALIAYHISFAAKLHRRGIARERLAVRLRELDDMPSMLARGVVSRLLC
jgi:hypothetical protein